MNGEMNAISDSDVLEKKWAIWNFFLQAKKPM